jgi:hypothetical protein
MKSSWCPVLLSSRAALLLYLCNQAVSLASASMQVPHNDTHNLFRNLPDPDWYQRELETRRQRGRDRRLKFKKAVRHPNPQQEHLVEISPTEWQDMLRDAEDPDKPHRRISWMSGSGSTTGESLSTAALADPGQSYDKWAQAYRMLGGFIDCDHQKQQRNDQHKNDKNGNNNNNNNNNQVNGYACSRWMLWASVSLSICCTIL